MEKYELEKALGGEENMANFSYGGSHTGEVKGVSKKIMEIVEIALRDTCVRSYRRAYDRVELE